MKKAIISLLSVCMALCTCLCVSAKSYDNAVLSKNTEYREELIELFGEEYAAIPDEFFCEELLSYYSGDEGATPDYVLLNATCYFLESTFSYRYDIGEYTFYDNVAGNYAIYLPKEDVFYTLEEAYYNGVEGIEEAFNRLYCEAVGKNGDINGDTFVNIQDVTYIQKYVANMIECGNSNPYVNANPELFERVSDLNRDHKINVKDATLLQKQIAKIVIPTTYGSVPATADSVEYTEINLGYSSDLGNSDRLITSMSQWKAYPHNVNKKYTEEFFEDKAFVHVYRTYYSGMVSGFVDGVYKEGDTLYVKYREEHPPINSGVTGDIGSFNVALEIDKELLEGVTKLVVEKNSYHLPPYEF